MAHCNSLFYEVLWGPPHTKNKITAVTVAGVPFQLQLDDLTWGLQLTPTGHRGA